MFKRNGGVGGQEVTHNSSEEQKMTEKVTNI